MWSKSLETLNPYEGVHKVAPDDLLPCPFCGAKLERKPPSRLFVHPRNDCFLSLMAIEESKADKWNRRYADNG